MPDDRDPSSFVGLAAVAMGLCCRLPVLLGAGVAVGAVGLVLGSVLLITAGIGVGAWGWRRYQHRRSCEVPDAAVGRVDDGNVWPDRPGSRSES